jgi:hypothetical protein
VALSASSSQAPRLWSVSSSGMSFLCGYSALLSSSQGYQYLGTSEAGLPPPDLWVKNGLGLQIPYGGRPCS